MEDQPRAPYPSDVSDDEWAFVAPYLTLMDEAAPQRRHPLREVFNGLLYVARTGLQWRAMPHDLPPWPAVSQQTRRWQAGGVFADDEQGCSPDDGFATSEADDWTAVRLKGDPNGTWGALKIEPAAPKVEVKDRVNIIQHPGGGPKQIALYHNVVAAVGEGRIQYLTDTLPGSSGSPVFDGDWRVVALHHSGGWLPQLGAASKQTYFRNEGIHVDVLVRGLAAARQDNRI